MKPIRWGICLAGALLIAGCQDRMAMTSDSPGVYSEPATVVDPVGIRPIPPIPATLHGCWDFIMPTDPDEPGSQHRLVVTATTITEIEPSGERKVATADFVERVTPMSIEGRYSYDDQFGRATLATGLTLDASGTLERDEGDAGGSSYRRCDGPAGSAERGR
jgi:hypothetical protein